MMPSVDDDSGSDREDELPQIVVIQKGDLSADEVKKIKGEEQSGDDTKTGRNHRFMSSRQLFHLYSLVTHAQMLSDCKFTTADVLIIPNDS